MKSLINQSKRYFKTVKNHQLQPNMPVHVAMNLYLDEENQRKYILNQNTTLKELQQQLIRSATYETVQFSVRNLENEMEQLPQEQLETVNVLGDCIMNKEREIDLQIKIDGKTFNYDFDRIQLAYFQNGNLDGVMQQLNIPHNQTFILNNFNHLLIQELNKNVDQITSQQVEQAINLCLSKMNQHNIELNEQNRTFLNNSKQRLIEIEQQMKQMDKEATNEGNRMIKLLILATLIQWIILFYLTFFVYGWDFCEPIAYLIAIGIETAVLLYFIKTFRGLGQSSIFSDKFLKTQQTIYRKQGTNFRSIHSMQEQKTKIIQSRIYFNEV